MPKSLYLCGFAGFRKRVNKNIFKKIKKTLDEPVFSMYNISCSLRWTTTEQDGELAEWSKAHDWKSCRRDERL